ncbi:MAG: hypothetical protein WKF70_11760, partial [Chitinophagaceae bacterium]
MKTNNSILALSIISSALLFSCSKEKEAPGVSYQMKTSSTSAPIGGRVAGGGIQWTSGYVWASEIEFEAENDNVEVEYKTETRQKLDLFSPLSSLGMITIPAGIYEDIEYEVEIAPNGTESAMEVSGTFTDAAGVATPIKFQLNAALEIEAEQANVTVTDGNNLTALTTLNLSVLTAGITETMLNDAIRTNGTIEISSTSNASLHAMVVANLKGCSSVEVD